MRTCDSPSPKYGGMECEMRDGQGMVEEQTRMCKSHRCPIHGGYGDWSKYSTCDKSCGGGLQYKHRCCIAPFPSHGGNDCSELGPAVEAEYATLCHALFTEDTANGVTGERVPRNVVVAFR